MERRLSAILAADMVGYSRLAEADEIGTVERQKSLRRELIDPVIREHRGRIFKEMGDGLLVEFPSVVEAVQCAVKIQRAMPEREASAPDNRKIAYRIGINLGDVIIDGDDIHGDGVNVAARLEKLAEPNGICVSGTAYDQMRSNVDVAYASLGEVQVKNIERPIRVYKVLLHGEQAVPSRSKALPSLKRARWLTVAAAAVLLLIGGGAWWWSQRPDFEPADPAKYAFALPDKPSIAVLPFANISGDPDQEYFADGLTEDMITRLASFPNLFVIAHNSTNKYKGQAVDIRDVAQNLGVRYVLEGSVRRSSDKLRITAQLIDALTGANIWAQNYDRKLQDLFKLQDEITREVGSRLASNIVAAEFERRSRLGTTDLEAYDFFTRGYRKIEVVTQESNQEAIRLFEQALDRDPKYARAMAGLAISHANNVRFRWASGADDNYDYAIALAKSAVDAAPEDEYPYRMLAGVYRLSTQYENAVETYQQALLRSPSNPDAMIGLSFTMSLMGDGAGAVHQAETAMRLNPYPQPVYFSWRGIAYFTDGKLDKALADFKMFQRYNPELHVTYMWKAASYALNNMPEEARVAATELLKRAPWFTISGYVNQLKPRGIEKDRLVAGLRMAKVPE